MQNLTSIPTANPDSCLSLSQPLLDLVISLCPPSNHTILSIGSGSGLLESLLTSHTACNSSPHQTITVHGIEPTPGLANKYLAADVLHLVPGTWAVLPMSISLRYGMWMFVYPRDKTLVRKYLDELETAGSEVAEVQIPQGSRPDVLKVLVWAGPKVDWEEAFRNEFCRQFLVLRHCLMGGAAGVAEWELVVVFDWIGGGKQAQSKAGGHGEIDQRFVDDL